MSVKHLDNMLIFENDKENEKIVWEVWLVKLPNMTKENFVSFNDFKKSLEKQACTKITDEEIMKEMLPVVEKSKAPKSNLT